MFLLERQASCLVPSLPNPHVVEMGHLFSLERLLAPSLRLPPTPADPAARPALTLPSLATAQSPQPPFLQRDLVSSLPHQFLSSPPGVSIAAPPTWGVEEKRAWVKWPQKFLTYKFVIYFLCHIRKHHSKRCWLFIWIKIRLFPFQSVTFTNASMILFFQFYILNGDESVFPWTWIMGCFLGHRQWGPRKPILQGMCQVRLENCRAVNLNRTLPEVPWNEFRAAAQHPEWEASFSLLQVVQDWKFAAQVLDRIFLWLFLIASVTGSVLIFTPALKMWLRSYH